MDFVYFLGRFHVLVLHLPIALLLIVILAEWLARREKYRHLHGALPFLWAASAITAIVTVVLGYMHFSEGGFTGPSALAHRFFGTSVAVVATTAWVLRAVSISMYRKVQALLGVVLVALVTLTGHFGGNLTHGDTFLVEYAPGPLRRLAGLQDARAPVTDPALADPYLDVVRPIFNQRCFSCHNDDKQRGGLNLAKYEAVMKGGKDGKVIAPGEPEKSDMYRRITLAKDHNDFMPAEGKTPLTDNQVALIRWWIQSGAQTGTTVAQLKVPPQTATLIASQLGVGAAGASAEAGAAHGDPQQNADPAIITKLEQAGFMARQESLSDARLVVSQIAPQSKFTDEQVAVLAEIGKQIVQLNLQHAGLKDTSLKSLQPLSELTHLRLENNDVTDRGIAELAGLAKLQYLNLYGNKAVTDAAVDSIAKLTALKHVYLWNTGVTPKGAVKLKELRPDLHIDMGVDSDSAARAAKVSG